MPSCPIKPTLPEVTSFTQSWLKQAYFQSTGERIYMKNEFNGIKAVSGDAIVVGKVSS